MKPAHLSLLGMPGAGKTTLGRALAAHFARPFIDLDAAIEARTGRAVPQLFAERGEADFRQIEAEVLRQVLARPTPLVLATGGGTPCFHHNLTALNQHSITLWLDVPVAQLLQRLQAAELARRPLLAAQPDLPRRLHETLTTRTEFYSQARLRCTGEAACTVAAVLPLLAAAGLGPATV